MYYNHSRFTHITVDVTSTKSDGDMTVLYVATAAGLIKKLSISPKTRRVCVVEVWGPLSFPPMTLQFLKDTQSLYVGTKNGLYR